MAIRTEPFTAAEAARVLKKYRETDWGLLHRTLWDQIRESMNEPTSHVVRYDANGVRYVPPTTFAWTENPSPSDCVWIVPGTHTREFNDSMLFCEAMTYGNGYALDGEHMRITDVVITDRI